MTWADFLRKYKKVCVFVLNKIEAMYILISIRWHLGRFQTCIHKIGSHEQTLGNRRVSVSSGCNHREVDSLLLSTGGVFLKRFVRGCPTVPALLPDKHTHLVDLD